MVYTFKCCFIPLRNKEKKIISYTAIDEENFKDV